jgi:hypothetical protein
MDTRERKQLEKRNTWRNYCKALNVDHLDDKIINSGYYQKGFKEWKILNKNYSYYAYCLHN